MWYTFNHTFSHNKKNIAHKKTGLTSDSIFWLDRTTNSDAIPMGSRAYTAVHAHNQLDSSTIKIPRGFLIHGNTIRLLLEEQKIISRIKVACNDINLDNLGSIEKASKQVRTALMRLEFSRSLHQEIMTAFTVITKSRSRKNRYWVSLQLNESLTSPEENVRSYFAIELSNATLLSEIKKILCQWYEPSRIREREQIGKSHTDFDCGVIVQEGFNPREVVSATIATTDHITKLDVLLRVRVEDNDYVVFKPGLRSGKESIIDAPRTSQITIPSSEIVSLAKTALVLEDQGRKPVLVHCIRNEHNDWYITSIEFLTRDNTPISNETFVLKQTSKILATGVPVGNHIAAGQVMLIKKNSDCTMIKPGSIVVTKNITPDFIPALRSAAGFIVEDHDPLGTTTLLAREIGIPCILGVDEARKKFSSGSLITLSCNNPQEGIIYEGALPYEVIHDQPIHRVTKTKVMVTGNDPMNVRLLHRVPHDGIGFSTIDYIFENIIRVHPLFLAKNKKEFGVEQLARTIGCMAAAIYPRPFTVRLSDATKDFFVSLKHGVAMERAVHLRNSGRGAERYLLKSYEPVVQMECEALLRVRETWGINNLRIMAPFCRTPEEGAHILALLASNGIVHNQSNWHIGVAAQIPGNIMLAEEFAEGFDELSVNLDELTPRLSGMKENKEWSIESKKIVEKMLADLVKTSHRKHTSVSVTGTILQRDAEVMSLAIKHRVDTIIVDTKTFFPVQRAVALAEKTVGRTAPGETNHQWLGMLTAFGFVAASLMSLGAGCGLSTVSVPESQRTPAQIRAEIQEMVRQERIQEEQKAKATATVSGFADFTVQYPRSWTAEYAPDHLTITSLDTKDWISFFIHKKNYPVKEDAMTSLLIAGKPALKFIDPSTVSTTPISVYELELPNRSILEIQSTSNMFESSIIESIQFRD